MKQMDFEELNSWLLRLVFVQIGKLGLFSREGVAEDPALMKEEAKILPRYNRWWDECLDMLETGGFIKKAGGKFRSMGKIRPGEGKALWEEWHQRKAIWTKNPQMRSSVNLVESCLKKLPEILRGRVLATDILFPASSMRNVEDMYQRNLLADYFNIAVAQIAENYVKARVARDPRARIRIIEIGAGTGGTTAMVLPRLCSFSGEIESYCYTDISRAFLLHGEKTYGPGCPFLEYRLLNIEHPLQEQGMDRSAWDMVIATDVLHATKNIRQTLRNTHALLKRNGILVLNEIIQKSVLGTLTFGLLDGWWRYEDEDLRIPGSPLVSPENWEMVLSQEGFNAILFPLKEDRELGHQIMVAESDGVIRQTVSHEQAVLHQKTVSRQQALPHQQTLPRQQAVSHQQPLPHQQSLSHPKDEEPRIENSGIGGKDLSRRGRDTLREYVADLILDNLSQTLDVPVTVMERDVPFADYGIDSILGAAFVKNLCQGLGITVTTAVIFDYTTVDRLARYLTDTYREQIRRGEAQGLVSQQKGPEQNKDREEKALDHGAGERDEACAGFGKTGADENWENICKSSDNKSSDNKSYDYKSSEAIAVIGMSGQFPGAGDVTAFWENLMTGKDAVGALPSSYLEGEENAGGSGPGEDSGYRRGGILEGRDRFDPRFFNISPREAESMNPHQRLILQESWKALEDAGINPHTLADSKTGLYVGAEPTGYFHESFTGSSDAGIASRLSYFLNLKGPAMVVNTGCSSSGVALHLACESLRSNTSALALAGGAHAAMRCSGLKVLARSGMLSPTGECHTFDRSANGTVLSEGVGMVVLKRLGDAIRDRDLIYGVIEGSGINQDGASNGMTAPNGVAQEELLVEVYRRFGINPERIGYIEAHGTGTRLGDPVEANALVRAFRQFTGKKGYCAVGSAKPFIGHTCASSGVIGLIKILLSIKHRKLPGLLHFKGLNPLIDFEDSPFYVNRERAEWLPMDDNPLTGALNTFGHSGTNVHLVVREFTENRLALSSRERNTAGAGRTCLRSGEMAAAETPAVAGPFLVPLSARNEERLKALAGNLLAFIKKGPGEGEAPSGITPADLAYTLQTGRAAMAARVIFMVRDIPGLLMKLSDFIQGKGEIKNCWKGDLQGARAMGRLFSPDDDAHRITAGWIANGNLKKIAEFWAWGGHMDWDLLYGRQKPDRIRLPGYPFAEERYWLSKDKTQGDRPSPGPDAGPASPPKTGALSLAGASCKGVPCKGDLLKEDGKAEAWDGLSYVPAWEVQAAGRFKKRAHKTVVLVFAGEDPALEGELVNHYRENHPETRVIRLQLASRTCRKSENQWCCGVDDPEGFDTCLKAFPAADSVWFVSTAREGMDGIDPDIIGRWQKANEIQLLRLVKALHNRGGAVMDCYVLTLDNYRIFTSSPQACGGGLTGLAYALAQGHHRFRVRNIDISSEDLETLETRGALVKMIFDEPPGDRGDLVKFMGGKRYGRCFHRLDWAGSGTKSGLEKRGVYVILGGSGTVGRVMTRFLMRDYQAKVIWLGRKEENSPEITEKIAQFRELGEPPVYIRADATSLEAMGRAVKRIKGEWGRINGAIFSGLVLHQEDPQAEPPEAEFLETLDLKTRGSLNFYTAFREEFLDFMCFFSSGQAFSFSGAARLSAYATGITFSDTLVHFLGNTASFPVGIVNWGFWKSSFQGGPLPHRINFIEDRQGFECFERFTHALGRHPLFQVLCMKASDPVEKLMNIRREKRGLPAQQADAALLHEPWQDGPGQREEEEMALTHAHADMGRPHEDTRPPMDEEAEESLRAHVTDVIRRSLADSLKVGIAEIDNDIPFSDYGVDSILGVGFIEQVAVELGIEMNTAVIFDYTTVNQLRDYVMDSHGQAIMVGNEKSEVKACQQKSEEEAYEGVDKANILSSCVVDESGSASRSVPGGYGESDQEGALENPVQGHAPMTARSDGDDGWGQIAVIGMSGQFPGARDVNTFWQNLIEEKDGVGTLPPAGAGAGTLGNQETPRCGGLLEDRDCFDPLFFNISPLEAESMNPHQRLILQESWKALEDSGYNPRLLKNTRTSIFVGAEPTGFFHDSFTGSSEAIIASRLSYYLDLKGPAVMVNTGCSSSAAAIHMACESLRSSESELAIAGGVFASLEKGMLDRLADIELLSPSGRCHSFDAGADGTAFSEGVGGGGPEKAGRCRCRRRSCLRCHPWIGDEPGRHQ